MITLAILAIMILVVTVSYKINRKVDDADDICVGINSKGDKWL